MALEKLSFEFETAPGCKTISAPWVHTGVVGSGDLEILLKACPGLGKVRACVTTPVTGFAPVWERVLARFVAESGLSDLDIEINDNNATPFIASLRLKQAALEAADEGGL